MRTDQITLHDQGNRWQGGAWLARYVGGLAPLYLMTAYTTLTRLCLRQLSVDGKSNEIPAVPVLLQLLELVGAP